MNVQRNLFDDEPTPKQDAHLARVHGKIAGAIREFHRVTSGEWHMDDLYAFVRCREAVAPASCDRILREMRRAGELNYEVLNRRQSLYRFQ